MPNPPVNKRYLSTRETGEFAGENVGFGLNHGVASAAPRGLSSNRRGRAARKSLRNVGDTCEGDAERCCQQNSRSKLGQKCLGSPACIRTPFDTAIELVTMRMEVLPATLLVLAYAICHAPKGSKKAQRNNTASEALQNCHVSLLFEHHTSCWRNRIGILLRSPKSFVCVKAVLAALRFSPC